MSNKPWFVLRNEEKLGPYSDDELVALIEKGIVTRTDFIWMFDLGGWIKVSESIYQFYLPENRALEVTE